jgi:transcriptional regulator with XRE-family HTH domain
MLRNGQNHTGGLTGHALRNAHLRERALARAETAPPLARTIVKIRAETLGMTRLELSRRSGISRGTLRDLELGIHTPTRRILQQFVAFCQQSKVNPDQVEEVRRLYAGPGDTLERFIARLELRAGSSRELARRANISPTTLWEYRRGNFPMRLPLLRRLCRAVGQDPAAGEALWHAAERQRFLDRGYPEVLAEFWVLCVRHDYSERHLLTLGLSTATLRRLRYLELPPWAEVADVARGLCRDEAELLALQHRWQDAAQDNHRPARDGFGLRLKRLRERQGIARRELADLFAIGGRKPARIIKHVEEDGYYSAQAYPAGLAAVLAPEPADQSRLLKLWRERRKQFHRRRRPEMRTDLRLARELYGFTLQDMEPILGYSGLEYQRIERGVSPLLETGQMRILEALHQAGQRRVEALLRLRDAREAQRSAWQSPPSLAALVTLLARREGGLIPLGRLLRKCGVTSFWPGRLRAMAHGKELPPWPVVEQLARACDVIDLEEVRRDWDEHYRARLEGQRLSPLAVELRLLIAEGAATLRDFSQRLGLSYSILIRDLQRIDRDEPGRWFHVERILRAAGLPVDGARWREVHALWYTADARKKKTGRVAPRLDMRPAGPYTP